MGTVSAPEGAGDAPRSQQASLLALVFCSGVAVMGLEMSASRLIAPYFGTTLSVWTSLIGLVMIFLTLGYYLGGALADRSPSRTTLGLLVLGAGLITLVLPLASGRVLRAAWSLTPTAGLLPASLLGTASLFAVPTVMLGCVCPFAMKLSIHDLGLTGRASGRVYAVSALGSVVGTFLPALVTIPILGVRRSIMVFGGLLVAAALPMLARARFLPAAGALALLAFPLPPVLPTRGAVAERESPYNYLRVIQAGPARLLIVDWSAFSAYEPGEFRTGQYYDYLLLAPLLRPRPPAAWLERVLIVGLGAGTSAQQITQAYGPLEIDGVEIDPAIVDFGRRYFDMDEPNLKVHVTDGRAFLAGVRDRYDWAVLDAYQGSDIPFHLVTAEFFQELRARMQEGGVLAINLAWWRPGQEELLRRLAASVRIAFPRVYAITGISEASGAVLLAGGADASPRNLRAAAAALGHPAVLEIAEEALSPGPPTITALAARDAPLTDDRAPVEQIADAMYRQLRREAHARERQVLAE